MLRITIADETSEQRWTLQGRLSGPWVAQLKSNWERSHGKNGNCKCVVDVSDVTFVDLRSQTGKFATIDYSDEPPALYLGEMVEFESLALKNLRAFEGWS